MTGRQMGALLGGLAASVLLVPAVASAESVAYVDNNEIWVATTDGSRKVQLSSGENQWRDVAHASGGSVVGVKLESGKIAQLSFFKEWGPTGAVVHEGILPNNAPGASLAAPLNIDLTTDGAGMVWGYSAYTYNFPVGTLVTGAYFNATANVAGLAPISISGRNYPVIAGGRMISVNGRAVSFDESPTSGAGGGPAATGWFGTAAVLDSTWDLTTVASNDAGTRIAGHFMQNAGVSGGKIAVVSTPGIGQNPDGAVDCWLPTVGIARSHPSISADGSLIAWQDEQGVKVAPMPTTAADPCVFPGPPVVISATGSQPDLGGFSVPAPVVVTPPPPVTTTPPPVAPPAATVIATAPTAKVTAFLATGIRTVVTPAVAGRVRVVVTVAPRLLGRSGTTPIVIGSASRIVAKGARVTIAVRPLARWRAKVSRLKGKRVTVRITVGTRTTVRVVTLR